jgi:zinc/manganese transport system substrate-binding protein
MKTKIAFGLLAGLLLLATAIPASAAKKLRVVTTIPDLADFTREIGGNAVEVENLATGIEDMHGIPIKPSFVPKLNHADAVVLLGMECEHSFLPALLDASKNPNLQPGKPGYIDTSRGILPLAVPKDISRAEGEVHPAGNPHYNLDPVAAKTIVTNICDGLVRLAPDHEAEFKAGRDAYVAQLEQHIAAWKELAKPLHGLKFLSYHDHWPYFAQRYGLTCIGTIELKHGIEPTAKHIADTINLMRAENCKVVVREPQFSERVPRQIADQTGAKLARLYIMAGGTAQTKTYFDLVDFNLRTLLDAAK